MVKPTKDKSINRSVVNDDALKNLANWYRNLTPVAEAFSARGRFFLRAARGLFLRSNNGPRAEGKEAFWARLKFTQIVREANQ